MTGEKGYTHWSVSVGIRSLPWLFFSLFCPFLPLSFLCLPSLPGQSSPKPAGGPQKVVSLTHQGGAREGGQWLQVRDRVGRGGCPQGWQPGAGKLKVKVAQSCLTLRLHGLYSPWNSPGQNTGVGSLLKGIFPTQESNPGIPHCRQILYQLSHKGSPRILEWVDLSFSRGSSQPRNQIQVSRIACRFFTS